ncbi:MAG: phosphoribosylglycinamide formyltransferase [Allomuricauda sp.]
MKHIVILASGSGSNAENIVNYFKGSEVVKVAAVLTNKRTAKVLDRCERLDIPAFYFNKKAFSESDTLVKLLHGLDTDLVVLAGFLWKIPPQLISAFQNKIINIHPALLPKYGGKGMYGDYVHQAVRDNLETETGITIHYVNENYDEGAIIHQAKTLIEPTDQVADIAQKVHQLEYEHFPKIIEKLLKQDG